MSIVRSAFLLLASLACSTIVAAPIDIIFDTDMGNDVDDALALGLIHALESRGECRLLAVTITKDEPLAAAFTDAVNTFYGRPDVPIGIVRGGPRSGRRQGAAALGHGGRLHADRGRTPQGIQPR